LRAVCSLAVSPRAALPLSSTSPMDANAFESVVASARQAPRGSAEHAKRAAPTRHESRGAVSHRSARAKKIAPRYHAMSGVARCAARTHRVAPAATRPRSTKKTRFFSGKTHDFDERAPRRARHRAAGRIARCMLSVA
jgi:hypothetical protein